MEPMNGFSYDAYELGLQQIVKPPVQYEEDDNFTFLMQYTSPKALLDKTPTFSKCEIQGMTLKVLNYTEHSLNFSPFITCTKGNCYLIAYHIKGSPEIICLEQKGDDYNTASERLFTLKNSFGSYDFIEVNHSRFSRRENLFRQHFTPIADVKKVTSEDSELKTVIQSISKEAFIKNNPSLIYFSPRVDSCSFTILNYTNHKINFNINGHLLVDDQRLTRLENQTCRIVAYHLENHPEIICFAKKNVNNKEVDFTINAKIDWEDYFPGYSSNSSDVLVHTPNPVSYDTYELGLQQIVSPPLEYKEDQTLKKFNMLNEKIVKNFTFLLQHTSPKAILNQIPTFNHYDIEGTIFKILNYTKHSFTFTKNRCLLINNQQIKTLNRFSVEFSEDHCHLIAYHIEKLPDVICLEQKVDDDHKAFGRLFIVNDLSGLYKHVSLQTLSPNWREKLSTRNFTVIPNVKNLISTDSGLKTLIQSIPEKALLKNNPSLLYFSATVDSCFFTILNHTNHEILCNIGNKLSIDGNFLSSSFLQEDCQFVAYHLKDHPETICFQQKDVKDEKVGSPFFANIHWKLIRLPTKIHKDAIKHRAFRTFWTGSYDDNSMLSNNQIPQDVLKLIISNYRHCK